MKKVKFEFDNSYRSPIIEIFEFDDDTTTIEIENEFNEWFYNELDRTGIEGHYEEID